MGSIIGGHYWGAREILRRRRKFFWGALLGGKRDFAPQAKIFFGGHYWVASTIFQKLLGVQCYLSSFSHWEVGGVILNSYFDGKVKGYNVNPCFLKGLIK